MNKGGMASLLEDGIQLNKLVVVDFFAEWCGPCKVMAPYFEKLAHELSAKTLFAQVDIDQSKELAIEHIVQSIPTIVAFKDGKEAARIVGSKSYKELHEWIEALNSGQEEGQIILRQQLHLALQQCDVEKVKELIEKDVNVIVPFDNQLTPLLMAIFVAGRIDGEKAAAIVELLVQAGAEWDAAQAQGKTLSEFIDLLYHDAQRVAENYKYMRDNLEK